MIRACSNVLTLNLIKLIKSINCHSWLHKNYYHAFSLPCDTPPNCNKTHEEGDQKQHSEEVIWTRSLVNLVRRLVVVHQGNLYRDNERNFYFLMPSNTLSQRVQVVIGGKVLIVIIPLIEQFSLECWKAKPHRQSRKPNLHLLRQAIIAQWNPTLGQLTHEYGHLIITATILS